MPSELKISNINSHKEKIKDMFKVAISVDCVIFGFDKPAVKILCIQSEFEEFAGLNSLVGDLVHPDETLENAAERILEHRTGLKGVPMRQVKAFGHPKRHPVGRVITIAFFALIDIQHYNIDKHRGLKPKWVNLREIDDMAFDHLEILKESLQVLRQRFFRDALYASLLPEKFTLSELQQLSEEVLRKKFDKRNFRKKMLSSEMIIETADRQENVSHRPAKLFRINEAKLAKSKEK